MESATAHGVVRDNESLIEVIGRVGGELDCYLQCISADALLGKRHLDTAFAGALANFHYGMNITRSFPLEIMVILSGQRQIKEALNALGIVKGMHRFIIIGAPRGMVDALITDLSTESLERYGKKFQGVRRTAVKEAMLAAGSRAGFEIKDNRWDRWTGPFDPNMAASIPAIRKLLKWNDIELSLLRTSDMVNLEKMVCERIVLSGC